MSSAAPKLVTRPQAGALGMLLVVIAWAAFGFLFGTHWLLLLAVRATTKAERLVCLGHFLSYIVALVILGGGGYWVRTSGTYVGCAGNISMSQRCMWEEQTSTYTAIYVMHFVGGCWLWAHWMLDTLQLPHWLLTGGVMRTFYSRVPLTRCAYTFVLVLTLVLLCLTWMVIVPWSSSDGVPRIAALLCIECVLLALGAIVVLKLACR